MENQAHNAEVAAYIKDYLNNENFAQFAVLLTGKWGSGKTHFILDLKKQYDALSPHEKLNENKEFNWIYVSLNGIDTVEEIEKRIFTAAHTWLNNTAVKLGKSFLGSIVASPQIYGIGFDTKKFAQDLKKILPKVKNAAFIFDDIERCRLPLSNLFGYINNFIEHDKLKVILVADEDKLKEYYAKEIAAPQQDRSFSTYEQVKEKLIGQTLEIKPDIASAIDKFIISLKSNDIQSIITKNRSAIIETFKQSKANNVRSLKAAFFNFQRLFYYLKNIEFKYASNSHIFDAQIQDLLLKILAITLAYKCGKISDTDEIYTGMSADQAKFWEKMFPTDLPNNIETEEQKYPSFSLSETHSQINWDRTPIFLSDITLFIKKGIFPDRNRLVFSFKLDYKERSQLQKNEDLSYLWLPLLNFTSLTPATFENSLQQFMTALQNYKFTKVNDILKAVDITMLLIDHNYNPLPQNQTVNEYFFKYLKNLIDNDIPTNFTNPNDTFLNRHTYRQILEKNKKLYEAIENNAMIRAVKALINRNDLIELLLEDDFKLITQPPYINFPLMTYVDANQLIKRINLSKLGYHVLLELFRTLLERYHNSPAIKREENKWLEELKRICDKEVKTLKEPFKSVNKKLIDEAFVEIDNIDNNN